jgi:transposase-like protein
VGRQSRKKEIMMPKPQPTFPAEFKHEAAQLARTSSKPKAQIARELGISDSALYSWRIASRKSSFIRFEQTYSHDFALVFPPRPQLCSSAQSRRSTWHSLERKRKISHEANRGEEFVASAHSMPDALLQRRGAWNGCCVFKLGGKCSTS